MAALPSSGTFSYQPALSDLVIDAYSRIQIRPTMITRMHMQDAIQSSNLLLAEWSIKHSVNLWEVELIAIPMVQATGTYSIPKNVVSLLDMYIRQYILANPVNLTPQFSTLMNSTLVTISQPDHGLIPGNWISVFVPVAIGGIILQGFYQLVSVIDANTYTVNAQYNALTTAVNTGIVPLFTATFNSNSITVTMTNHGLFAGNTFTIQVGTIVGGLTLSGIYNVTSVIDANNFVIQASNPSGTNDAEYENGGLVQIIPQTNAEPQDRVILPISRSEYAAQPNKFQQAYPTSFWWDRTINSTITFWPVPDMNGPYVCYMYCMTQIQDAVLPGGVTMDLPYRFYEAFTAGLAAKLALKYPPPPPNSIQLVKQYADESWELAERQDAENVPLYITPGLSGFWG